MLTKIPTVNYFNLTAILKSSSSSFSHFFRSFKIYTRTGDDGRTALNVQTGRLPKYAQIFGVLGDIDELSSSIGVAVEHCKESEIGVISDDLYRIQHRLQDINSILAARPDQLPHLNSLDGQVKHLEDQIDWITSNLDPLRSFIIPSGGSAACHLHLSRAICRRAERSLCLHLTNLNLIAEDRVMSESEKYLNRLSDYLFTAARYCAKVQGCQEKVYSSKSSKSV